MGVTTLAKKFQPGKRTEISRRSLNKKAGAVVRSERVPVARSVSKLGRPKHSKYAYSAYMLIDNIHSETSSYQGILEATSNTEKNAISNPEVSQEVKRFIADNDLKDAYEFSLNRVRHLIPGLISIKIALESDFDSEKQWVSIASHVDAEPRAISDANDKLLDSWIDGVPRGLNGLIRFEYWFVD